MKKNIALRIFLAALVGTTFAIPSASAAGRGGLLSWKVKDYLKEEIKPVSGEGYWLGPIGVRAVLHGGDAPKNIQPQAWISVIEKGSPSEGKLQVNDVILGINGTPFSKLEPREEIGAAIDKAEDGDGKLTLQIFRRPGNSRMDVVIQIPLLKGNYSATAPFNCPKTDRIIELSARYISENKDYGRLGLGALALLATGEKKYITEVGEMLKNAPFAQPIPDIPSTLVIGGKAAWEAGFNGILMAEYCLLTGDKSIFPGMRDNAIRIAMGQDKNGLWGHGFSWTSYNDGEFHGKLMGYGAVNAAGLPCFLALVLAKKAGVSHPEVDAAIKKSSDYFRMYVGRGRIGYGFHPPSPGHESNGKNSAAAVIYQILGDKESARYFTRCALSDHYREEGHTGNFFANLWGGTGAASGGREACIGFYNSRIWYRTVNRSWNGSFRSQYHNGSVQNSYAACSSTGAWLLNHLTSRRVLYVTGKGVDDSLLSSAEVKECLSLASGQPASAERATENKINRFALSAAKLDTETLLKNLSSWSAALRPAAAEELAKRDVSTIMPRLIKILEGDDLYAQIGAAMTCAKIGELSNAATPAKPASSVFPALPALERLLAKSNNDFLSESIILALGSMGEAAAPALPALLNDANRITYPGETTELRMNALMTTVRAITTGTGKRDVAGNDPFVFLKKHNIDTKLYMSALSNMLRPGSSSQTTNFSMPMLEKHFTLEQIIPLVDSLLDCANSSLWTSGPIQTLSRLRIEEVLPTIWSRMDSDMRTANNLPEFEPFAANMKDSLPRLCDMRITYRNIFIRKSLVPALDKTIDLIEKAGPPTPPVSARAMLHDIMEKELPGPASKPQRLAALRKILADAHPTAHIRKTVALEKLVATDKTSALPDLLAVLAPPADIFSEATVRLARTYKVEELTAAMGKAKGSSLAGIIHAIDGTLTADGIVKIIPYLSDPNLKVRIAACNAIGNVGTQQHMKPLVELLVRASDSAGKIDAEGDVPAEATDSEEKDAAADVPALVTDAMELDAAVEAMGKIRRRSGVPDGVIDLLRGHLEKHIKNNTGDTVAKAMALAIAEIGGRDKIAEFHKMCQDIKSTQPKHLRGGKLPELCAGIIFDGYLAQLAPRERPWQFTVAADKANPFTTNPDLQWALAQAGEVQVGSFLGERLIAERVPQNLIPHLLAYLSQWQNHKDPKLKVILADAQGYHSQGPTAPTVSTGSTVPKVPTGSTKAPTKAPTPAAEKTGSTGGMRDWTNADGKTIRAEGLSRTKTTVKLKLENGKVVDYPLAKLAEANRKLVSETLKSE